MGRGVLMFLSDLKIGDSAEITEISVSESDRQRLLNLGIAVGTKIEALYKSPFGNPKAYLARGTVFALRNETAAKITVEKI